jgi:hypothetical protein
LSPLDHVGGLGRLSRSVAVVCLGLALGLGVSSVAVADAPPGPSVKPSVDSAEPAPSAELAELAELAEPEEMIGAPSAQPSEFDGDPVPEVIGVQVDLEAGAARDELPSPTRERSSSASTASSQVAVLGLVLLALGLVAGFLLLRRRR